MIYNENVLAELRDKVSRAMSDRRFMHTLGVERAAARLGEIFMPERVDELRAAALLHDIAKELPRDIQLDKIYENEICRDHICVDAALHSYAAPAVIISDFPDFATKDILDSVRNHTLGKPDMGLFSEIIYISDYIEDGRTYLSCRTVANELWEALDRAITFDEKRRALRAAIVRSIDFTVKALSDNGKEIDELTLITKNAYQVLI